MPGAVEPASAVTSSPRGGERRGRRHRGARAGRDVDYRLTPAGAERLARLGIEVADPGPDGLPLRYCVD